jgi:hypothetical protein
MADRAFVVVSIGPRPADARPLLASDDPGVVDATMQAILARLPGQAVRRRDQEPEPATEPVR